MSEQTPNSLIEDDLALLRATIKKANSDLLPEGGVRMPKSISPGAVFVVVSAKCLERVLDAYEEHRDLWPRRSV